MKPLFAGLTALLMPLAALGQTASPPWRPLLSFGLTGGGDTFDSFRYADGSTKSVKAGGLVQLSMGIEVPLTPRLSVQVNVGYHADSVRGSDGRYTFRRFPVEVLGHWRVDDQWRVGGGLRSARNPRISSSGSLSGQDAEFSASVGLIAEAEYFVRPNLGLKARLVSEKYTDQAPPRAEFRGDHVGIFANLYFR